MTQRCESGQFDNLLCKNQKDGSFSCVCPAIDNEFCHNIVQVLCGLVSYFDNVMTKFVIDNLTRRTHIKLTSFVKNTVLFITNLETLKGTVYTNSCLFLTETPPKLLQISPYLLRFSLSIDSRRKGFRK